MNPILFYLPRRNYAWFLSNPVRNTWLHFLIIVDFVFPTSIVKWERLNFQYQLNKWEKQSSIRLLCKWVVSMFVTRLYMYLCEYVFYVCVSTHVCVSRYIYECLCLECMFSNVCVWMCRVVFKRTPTGAVSVRRAMVDVRPLCLNVRTSCSQFGGYLFSAVRSPTPAQIVICVFNEFPRRSLIFISGPLLSCFLSRPSRPSESFLVRFLCPVTPVSLTESPQFNYKRYPGIRH